MTKLQYNNFSDTENEIISLNVIIETIDSIINSTLFELLGENSEKQVMFHDELHQKYFYIITVDFLSKTDKNITGHEGTCIELLESICNDPKFNNNNSISHLKNAKNSFKSWIEEEVQIDVWFPDINKTCPLKLTRKEFIMICGNISKHHFARLSQVSKQICKILKRNNIEVSFYKSLELLDDFYERFHNDILNYHASNIAEMLNNINWGIYNYLLPSLQEYNTNKIENKFAKGCHIELINFINRKPYIEKFESTKYLKLRY